MSVRGEEAAKRRSRRYTCPTQQPQQTKRSVSCYSVKESKAASGESVAARRMIDFRVDFLRLLLQTGEEDFFLCGYP